MAFQRVIRRITSSLTGRQEAPRSPEIRQGQNAAPPATASDLVVGSVYVRVGLPVSTYIYPNKMLRATVDGEPFRGVPLDQGSISLETLDYLLHYDLYIHKGSNYGTIYRVVSAGERGRVHGWQLDVVDVFNVRDLSHQIGLVRVYQLPPAIVPFVDSHLRQQQKWSETVADTRSWTFSLLLWLEREMGRRFAAWRPMERPMERAHVEILGWASGLVGDAISERKPRPVWALSQSGRPAGLMDL